MGRGGGQRVSAVARVVEHLVLVITRAFAWLFLILLVAILVNVALRYVFDRPLTLLSELQWHLYATTAMVGLSYALVTDAHVRVDLLSARFLPVLRKSVETVSLVLLLVPLCVFLIINGWDFAATSWKLGESSALPGGLPFRWIVKGTIPAGGGFLLVAALTRCVRIWVPFESSDRSEYS